MGSVFLNLISTTFLFHLGSAIATDPQLKFVAIVYRHGDRAPISDYPLDPWRNVTPWVVEAGELTNRGKQQHYALGQWLRSRYSTFISDQFDPTEVCIKSTDVDRTLMSAQANLAGMFPPIDSSVWNPHLNWQPIPVHTDNPHQDAVLAMMKPCPAYDEEMKRYNHSKEYQDIVIRYQPLMKYLTKHTGMKIDTIRTAFYIYDILLIENLYNLTLPDWTKAVFPEKLLELCIHSFVTPTATTLLKLLHVSPFIKEVTTLMQKATNTNHTLKMMIYSGHDDTIADILNSLDLFNFMAPPYTSTLFFELFLDTKANEHFVKILYRNSTEIVEPYVLHIPLCGDQCPLERFMQIYAPMIDIDWERSCKISSLSVKSLTLAIISCMGIGCVAIFYIARKFCMTKSLPKSTQLHRCNILEISKGAVTEF